MRIQLLSDLHLETEVFDPEPAPGADVLVLAGDIDSTWQALDRFEGWPQPVLVVAGNHEFDRRELDTAWPALRTRCSALGLTLLERESIVLADTSAAGALHSPNGRRIRFCGTVRWSDFEVFGPADRDRAVRAATYYTRVMQATQHGQPFDAAAVRIESLACRAWLAAELAEPAQGRWDATVVITHYAPSLRSADPRYGVQPATASFCNADDDLLPLADLWLHGHLHCRHDYAVPRGDGRADGRVVCMARGLAARGETEGYDPRRLIEV